VGKLEFLALHHHFQRQEFTMISAITHNGLRLPTLELVLTPSRKAQLMRGKVVLFALSRLVWRWL
jgi:hypothetical protein